MSRPVIGFAGLTHLGLVSAVAAASKGFRVVGYDVDRDRIARIEAGRLAVVEPGLDELYREHRTRLSFSDRPSALRECDVVYVASDVPTDARGVADLENLSALIERVLPALDDGAVLVVLSQVPPGFTRGLALPAARRFYQVETLVFGRAVERAMRPERFIVGCIDPDASLPPAYAALLQAFGCPILTMRYESAELAKIAINCYLVAAVTVVNTLAEISERIGADWGEIVPALRLDARIGPQAYLTPGLGLAGGNLERDLATVLRLSAGTGTETGVIRAFLRNSWHRRDWVLRVLHAEVLAFNADAMIGVLGLAYKENTDSTRNSPSLELIGHLKPWRLRVYDPVVSARVAAHPAFYYAAAALEAAQGADALVIMTPWSVFRELKPSDLAAVMAGRTVIDPHRVLDGRAVAMAGLDYFALGMPSLRAGPRLPDA